MLKVGIFLIITQVRLNKVYVDVHRRSARKRHPQPIARIFDQGKGCDEVKSSNTALSENPLQHAKAVLNIDKGGTNDKRTNRSDSDISQKQILEGKAKKSKKSFKVMNHLLYLIAGFLISTVAVYKLRVDISRPIPLQIGNATRLVQFKCLPPPIGNLTQRSSNEEQVLSEVVVLNEVDLQAKVQTVDLSKDVKLTVSDRIRLLQYAIDRENASKTKHVKI